MHYLRGGVKERFDLESIGLFTFDDIDDTQRVDHRRAFFGYMYRKSSTYGRDFDLILFVGLEHLPIECPMRKIGGA